MSIKNCQRTMLIWCFLTKLLQLKSSKKSADIRRHKHFSWILHSNNSVRMHRIIMVLLPFFISIQWTIGLCQLIFNWAPLIFTQFEPHGFSCSEPCCAHINPILYWGGEGGGGRGANLHTGSFLLQFKNGWHYTAETLWLLIVNLLHIIWHTF